MSVLDQLPEGELQRLTRELDASQREIKSPQPIGSSGVMMGIVTSGNPIDVTVPAGDARDVLLSYTPADTAFGGGLVYRAYQSTNGGLNFNEINVSQRLRVGSDNVQKWRIQYFNGSGGTAINLKFLFLCIGSGTFTASLVT
ncbi:hypothetical protein [Arthrobacter sp. KNU40]|uniref:hypothetical protein n=1 Tax=Arthrobacter sp. KNU40 TaxID=3447965 RepID=UPI003F645F10